MKRLAFFLPAVIVLIAACNNNKTKDSSGVNSKEQVTIDPKMQNAILDMEKQKAELEKLTPLTTEELKKMIPETLMGAARTNDEANSAMGATFARGDYKLNDSTAIKLNIYDCAGSGGAGIYSLQYLGMMNVQQDSDEEYTKTIDFKGGKAFEHCDKTSNDCTFTWFASGRFLVTLEGDNINADTLKQAARGLDIK